MDNNDIIRILDTHYSMLGREGIRELHMDNHNNIEILDICYSMIGNIFVLDHSTDKGTAEKVLNSCTEVYPGLYLIPDNTDWLVRLFGADYMDYTKNIAYYVTALRFDEAEDLRCKLMGEYGDDGNDNLYIR